MAPRGGGDDRGRVRLRVLVGVLLGEPSGSAEDVARIRGTHAGRRTCQRARRACAVVRVSGARRKAGPARRGAQRCHGAASGRRRPARRRRLQHRQRRVRRGALNARIRRGVRMLVGDRAIGTGNVYERIHPVSARTQVQGGLRRSCARRRHAGRGGAARARAPVESRAARLQPGCRHRRAPRGARESRARRLGRRHVRRHLEPRLLCRGGRRRRARGRDRRASAHTARAR